MRIEGDYPEDLADWIRGEAIRRGLTTRKFLSHLAADFRSRSVEAEAKPKRPPSRKEQLIERVRESNSIVKSATALGISIQTVREWQADPQFAADLQSAQAYWIESLQESMHEIGLGKRVGDANALSRLLNAHHPSFGRAKTEMILRVLDPLVKRLVERLQRALGDEAKALIEKEVEAWQTEKRKRLSLVG